MARRLPVYILIDTSGSMKGEPIESVKVGLADMIATLRQNPYALETVWISIITYDKDVNQILPLTELEQVQIPSIFTPDSGPTHTGAALQLLCSRYDAEVQRGSSSQKGDWRPIVFLLTDGKPSDIMLYNEMIPEIQRRKFGNFVACAAGPKAHVDPLKKLTDNVFILENMDSTSFRKLFEWVSDTVGDGGKTAGIDQKDESLPPPPQEVNLVI